MKTKKKNGDDTLSFNQIMSLALDRKFLAFKGFKDAAHRKRAWKKFKGILMDEYQQSGNRFGVWWEYEDTGGGPKLLFEGRVDLPGVPDYPAKEYETDLCYLVRTGQATDQEFAMFQVEHEQYFKGYPDPAAMYPYAKIPPKEIYPHARARYEHEKKVLSGL